MKSFRVPFSVCCAVLLVPTVAVAADVSDAKLLNGPPSEFAALAPANAASSLQTSKSALIPIDLRADGRGNLSWQSILPVEGESLRMALLAGGASDWSLQLTAPASGRSVAARSLAARVDATNYGIDGASYAAEYYSFENTARGNWTVSVSADSRSSSTRGFLLVEGAGPTRLRTAQVALNQTVGQRIGFTAAVAQADSFGAIVNSAARVGSVSMTVTAPDGSVSSERFYDDGRHDDGRANDGVYGGAFNARLAGDYNAQIRMDGVGVDGLAFLRTAEHLVPVVAASLSLASSAPTTEVQGDRRLAIRVPVNAGRESFGRHYRVYGEVWADASNGQRSVPVAWVGGMKQVNNGAIELSLDARWIALAGAAANLEIRGLRIEDPDHFISIAKADRLSLGSLRLPAAAQRAVAQVDEEMLMGPRPANLRNGVGKRLLLVHGYCSSNVWGPVSGQFGTASVFLDLNKNRSHDAFAQLIKNFGATWNSFGIVAHSQGGAAATHLYQYYWSGLDNATGSRLIQSVGTPYQGTNLAGNLAALGSIFGAGCGTNSNLTYSGASSWLAGISSSTRAKVNYSTTSFTDRSWVYDYCHLATDLLLSDPDDGTTERAYGQLSGAINRGHKTGWCHTGSMRDPAQTTDSSRNSDMNANAAR